MMQFVGCEVVAPEATERTVLINRIQESDTPVLVLNTCQRLECYGTALPPVENRYISQSWDARTSFERLARIAAGLESRILGELEVMGQVRAAYRLFHGRHGHKLSVLDRFFQDAIALGRKARRASGIDREMTSLSGLAASEILDRTPPGSPIAVIGSGTLAASAARYLSKRGEGPIRVMSRCPIKAASLALKVGGFGAGLDQLSHLLDDAAGILCATAAPHALLYPHHLHRPNQIRTIVDLGEPPDCHEEVRHMSGIHYQDLLDIEAKADIHIGYRRQAAERAEQLICDGAAAWSRQN